MKKIFGWMTLAIAIIVILFMQVLAAYSGSQPPATSPISATQSSTTTSPAIEAVKIKKVAERVTKLYFGVPSAKGLPATLQSLNSYVTADLRKTLKAQWQGTDNTGVRAAVQRVTAHPAVFSAADPNRATAEVNADYTMTHVESGEITSYNSTLLLSLVRNSKGAWRVSAIQPLS